MYFIHHLGDFFLCDPATQVIDLNLVTFHGLWKNQVLSVSSVLFFHAHGLCFLCSYFHTPSL